MYQHDFICTYKLHSPEDQPEMYRIQLLQAFELSAWDNEAMDKGTKEIFDRVGSHPDVKAIIDKARKSKCCESVIMLVDSNDFTIFTTLFQYDLFDLLHRCICDVLSRKGVNPTHRDMLLKAME